MVKSQAKKQEERNRRAKEKSDHWVIVYNPWFPRHGNRQGRFHGLDLQHISWWLERIFGVGKLQAIQHKTNEKSIIVKVDLDVNIHSKLGQHSWSSFLYNPTAYESQESSKIFEYNFIEYGDPSDNQWQEFYPPARAPPSNFPIVNIYPAPVWCDRHGLGQKLDWFLPLEATSKVPSRSQTEPIYLESSEEDGKKERPRKGLSLWLAPTGNQLLTQLVSIQNPFGLEFPSSGKFHPKVSGLWDWLQLVADGALVIYYSVVRAPKPDQEWIIARLPGEVDLKGVIGKHSWQKMLRDCPNYLQNEVTTVVHCKLDPEIVAYQRIYAPEPTEDYKCFTVPYPPPIPLLEEDTKLKTKQEVGIKHEIEAELKEEVSNDDDKGRINKKMKLEA